METNQKRTEVFNGSYRKIITDNEIPAKIYETTDYKRFKSIFGNRNVNLQHVNRIKTSMEEHYLFTVIIVNEKYEIIDGQHRFDAIVQLNLPLYYIICSGYGLNEVQRLNANSKNWSADDYMEGYCELGYKDYIIYRDFKKKYKVNHSVCLCLLTGVNSGNSTKIKPFHNGAFKVKDLRYAELTIEKIFTTSAYYSNYKNTRYVYALTKLLKNKNFKFEEFLKKLKKHSTMMQDCSNTEQYVALIEEIYNHHRKDKVNLRFP